MQNIIKSTLKGYFDEYVKNLDTSIDGYTLPVTLRDLELKAETIQEDFLDESSFELSSGSIGSVQLRLTWSGQLEVVATDVKLLLGFSPVKAVKKAINPPPDADGNPQPRWFGLLPPEPAPRPPGPPPMRPPGPPPVSCRPGPLPMPIIIPPRYCSSHDTSEKRLKTEPYTAECQCCKMKMQINYADFSFCAICSDKEQKCMICGAHAPNPGIARPLMPPAMPPPGPGAGADVVRDDSRHGEEAGWWCGAIRPAPKAGESKSTSRGEGLAAFFGLSSEPSSKDLEQRPPPHDDPPLFGGGREPGRDFGAGDLGPPGTDHEFTPATREKTR